MPGTAPEFLKEHEIVRAGAGAGKTYTLTHKVMDLADEYLRVHKKLPRLVVTTFTRKATQELRERLMILALEERPHLVDFVNSRSHLVVSTIHGVMDLYLKRYGANICIDPSYRVVAGPEASKIARQTLRQILLTDPEPGEKGPGDLLETFQFNRLASLVRRLDEVLAEKPEAHPFTAADFETIFKRRAKETADMLREAALRIREETTKPAWNEMAESYIGLASCLTSKNWQEVRPLFISGRDEMKIARRSPKGEQPVSDATIEFAKAARDKADDFLEPIYDPEAWRIFSERYEVINEIGQRFSKEFRKAKLDQGLLEISDLEHLAMDCIRKHPQTAEAFWQEWDHWLIDEYQDTSPFQVELLSRLSGEKPNFVVGDPQQSIYLFRGARSEVFGEKHEQIIKGGGAEKLLSVNRRSQPELLLFFNDFFAQLPQSFQPMEPFFSEGQKIDSTKQVATFFIAQKPDDDEVKESGDDELDLEDSQELRAIVAHVQKLILAKVKPEDICILGRTNRVLTEAAEWLNRYRLPTHVHAASGFYDRREIRDALALLKFLVNPHDNANLVELLRSPWFRMPDRALAPITRKRPESVWNALIEERSMSDEFRVVSKLQRLNQMTFVESLSETFRRGLIEGGFIDLSHKHDVSGRRESNVWKLLAKLQAEECKPSFNPLGFIAGNVSDIKTESNAEGDAVAAVEPNRINLMTVHASKGLEFKHVILPRMDQKPRLTTNEEFTFDEEAGLWAVRVPFGENRDMTGSLPESAWLEKFRTLELDEHARVLYVALTRASESVFLSWTAPAQKNSWAEMVKLDLASGTHQAKNYSYRVEYSEPQLENASVFETAAVEPRAKWISKDHETEKAMSVSDILDSQAGVHYGTRTRGDVTQLLKLASQGTAVHRLMEMLKYPSRDRMEKLVTRWFPDQVDRVLEAVSFVRESREPALIEIIASGEVEWGFAITESGKLIEGQVDLWGRDSNGCAWIIDYKTGNPKRRDSAFKQMSLYALALRKSGLLKDDEPLKLAAVYPFSREVFVEEEPSREKILELLKLDGGGR